MHRTLLTRVLPAIVAALALLDAPAPAQDQADRVHTDQAHAADTHTADTHTADTHAGDGHTPGAHDDHTAHDDHGEHASVIPTVKQGLVPAITALITFGIVFGVLYVAVWPKINSGLDERARKITDEIAAAELARKQAKDALDEYEKNLAEARAEARRMLEETKSQQATLAAELRARADAELAELRDRARHDIESAKKTAIAEIYSHSVALATSMASKILQREVTAADQQRLVEESLAELQARA